MYTSYTPFKYETGIRAFKILSGYLKYISYAPFEEHS